MATLQQVKEGLNDALDSVLDGWRRLYHQAAGAITRFRPGVNQGDRREIADRALGWGILACEVFDDGDKVVVRLEAPGMNDDDFDLQVVEDYLVIKGEKQMESESTRGGYHITECAYGSFERAVPLPGPVEADNATANYKRGVLRVELPKATSHKRRRITVNS